MFRSRITQASIKTTSLTSFVPVRHYTEHFHHRHVSLSATNFLFSFYVPIRTFSVKKTLLATFYYNRIYKYTRINFCFICGPGPRRRPRDKRIINEMHGRVLKYSTYIVHVENELNKVSFTEKWEDSE